MNRRLNAILICIALIFFSYTAYADTKSDLEAQNRQAQSEIEQIKEEIKQKEASKTPYLEKKKKIDRELNAANAELLRLVNQVSAIESEINAKEADIKWLDGEESKSREVFKMRMRSLYEDNKMSYIDILFDSVSISDFLYRIEVIKQLADFDKEIIDSIIHSREKIAEAKTVLEEKKVEVEDYHVMPEVLPMIAEKIDTNIRELEGMLNKTVSLASLIGKRYATIEEAEEALKDVEDNNKEQITIDKIIEIICGYYNVKKSDLIGKKRNKEIVDPRQICVYIITELLDVPLDSIGKALGGRDHTTIMHARDKVANNIKTNKGLKTTVSDLIAMIKKDD